MFSDWPTFPQLYVRGELIGGLDILKELQVCTLWRRAFQLRLKSVNWFVLPTQHQGSIADQLGILPLEKRLQQLVSRAPVMLFMKGEPEVPHTLLIDFLVRCFCDADLPNTHERISDCPLRIQQGDGEYSSRRGHSI